MTWIFKAGKCTTSSFLVSYGNKQNNGMRKGNGMHVSLFKNVKWYEVGLVQIMKIHTIILPIPIPDQNAGSCTAL